MSETSKTFKAKAVESDKTIKIEVGAGFYNRVQTFLADHINTVEPEVSIKALNEVKTREPESKFEYNLLTLLTLIYSIEKQFNDEGLTKNIEIPIPD